MTPLGRPVVFHLKYMAEMNRLYARADGEGPELTGLDNWEQVREMARAVRAAAYEQVADFLELCGKRIEDHFAALKIATLAKKSRRASVVRKWSWGVEVRVSSVPQGPFSCGLWVTAPPEVDIPLVKDACGVVVPWLWSKGGRKGEDALWQVVGGWAERRSGAGLVTDRGAVALACIPIKAQPPDSFNVDRDQLIAEVLGPIARIGSEQTTAIANSVSALKEPDEP